ncbi:hypothetical protein [Gloeobacter kilaueensis]|uniref:Uncharacterized protein n=1 Tax=Gloeobacter kilaueensis (strain ATCC BAA-2537 / CCAP 1431/1 / ULC 316 / JS1) TaxID=1183438 RepID=U5QCY4_GLOK1|nr:hypothetical protein [Gloeobacter kilaueensis]AGY56708.1 hypothetical protein GKIL_0462 [Gloeobacter kilaueensis JS1]
MIRPIVSSFCFLALAALPVSAEVLYAVGSPGTLLTVDLDSGRIETRSTLALPDQSRLNGVTVLADDTVLLAGTVPGVRTRNYLALLGNGRVQTLNVTGLAQRSALLSVLATRQGALLGVASAQSEGVAQRLVTIDRQTGKALPLADFALSKSVLLSNLTQCPNGRIYGTTFPQEGGAHLVRVDLLQHKLTRLPGLQIAGQPFGGGIKSLACSGANELFALSPSSTEGQSVLYRLDAASGSLNEVLTAEIEKIAFRP